MSTQVGYRIRGIEPPDLATFADPVKRMWWQWVVDFGLQAKDRDLARGLDADGDPLRPLKPESIKHRKSEVGPTHKHAPPLEPSYARSRVRSLLRGRAHTNSAEFFWAFDSHSHGSFAEILIHQRDEYGRDVFGLSPIGTAWVRSQALKKWRAWKATGNVAGPAQSQPGREAVKQPSGRWPMKPIPVVGRIDIQNMDLMGDGGLVKRAIAAGQFTGFRRLNAVGEKWRPGSGVGFARR